MFGRLFLALLIATGVGAAAGPSALADQLPSSSITAPVVLDPRATIGEVNCSDPTAAFTLDNSRSNVAVLFIIEGTSDGGQTLEVSAGASQLVNAPVGANSELSLSVSFETEEDTAVLATTELDCTREREDGFGRADVGRVDCSTVTVPVTLDNSAETRANRFSVYSLLQNGFRVTYDKTFRLPAGATRTISVPLVNHAVSELYVADDFGAFGFLFTEPIRVACSARVSVLGEAHQLASTGGSGPTLPVAGLVFVAAGAAIMFSGRRGGTQAH